MTSAVEIGILELGRYSSTAFVKKHGTYPKLFARYFANPDFHFVSYPISRGAPLPKPTERQAWILTGSPHGVYEDIPFIRPTEAFIAASMENTRPVLGICFGHQLMAQAFGGIVVKSEKGRGVGLHSYRLTEAGRFLNPGADEICLPALHQDQVIVAPKNATVLAHSEFCNFAALSYGRYGLSLQGHMEFPIERAREDAILWHAQSPIERRRMAEALASFDTKASSAESLRPRLSAFLAGQLVTQSP